MRPWQRPAHRLPVTVRPAAGELLASYVARLALANGLPEGSLLCWVGECGTIPRQLNRWRDGSPNDAARRRLETITSLPAATLVRALPGVGVTARSVDGGDPGIPTIRWRLQPAAARWVSACRACTARSAGGAHVVVEVPAHRHLCQRHHRWLHRDRSFLVTAQITRAQRAHDRLVRRCKQEVAARAFQHAESIVRDWWGGHWHPELHRRWDHRLHELGVFGWPIPAQLVRAVLYPEAVALAALLASASWDARLRAGHATAWQFYALVANRLALDPHQPTAADPLLRWLITDDPRSGRCPHGLRHEDPLLEFRRRAWTQLADAT
jgi:TniQ